MDRRSSDDPINFGNFLVFFLDPSVSTCRCICYIFRRVVILKNKLDTDDFLLGCVWVNTTDFPFFVVVGWGKHRALLFFTLYGWCEVKWVIVRWWLACDIGMFVGAMSTSRKTSWLLFFSSIVTWIKTLTEFTWFSNILLRSEYDCVIYVSQSYCWLLVVSYLPS